MNSALSSWLRWWCIVAASYMTGTGLGELYLFFTSDNPGQFSIWTATFTLCMAIQHLHVKYRAQESRWWFAPPVFVTTYYLTLGLYVHYLVLAVIYFTWTVDFLTIWTPTSET